MRTIQSIMKFGVAGILVLLACTSVKAQNELQLNVNYNINFPTGSFRDLVTNPAYKGLTIGLAYPINSQWSVGLSFGYNDYYQKYPRETYSQGKGSDISAVVSNSIQQLPVLIQTDYTLLKTGVVRPYIGAGVGVNFINFDQYLGEFDNPQSMTKLALRGEAGVLIPLSHYSSTALKIGGSYNYAPFNNYGIKSLDNWGVQAGIRFGLR